MSDSSIQFLSKTFRHSSIYMVGGVIRQLTGLIMLPIYTNYLTPSDYGMLSLLTMVIDVVAVLLFFRVSVALFRYYVLAKDEKEKKLVVSTVLILVFTASIFGAILLNVSAFQLSEIIFGDAQYQNVLILFSYTLLTNAVTAVVMSYLRARRQPMFYLIVNVSSLGLQVICNIVFVVALDMHILGVVYSSLLSGVVISIFLGIYVIKNVGLSFSVEFAKKIISFIAPLIVASFVAVYISYVDKYYLRLFEGLAAVGLYVLAGKLCIVLSMISNSFNGSWAADRLDIIKRNDSRKIFDQVFRLLSAVLLAIGVGLSLFAHDIFRIMASPEFHGAGSIVPLLVIVTIIKVYTQYCNLGLIYKEHTRDIAIAHGFNAIVITVVGLIFIPYFGMVGAAISIIIGSLIELLWTDSKARKLYDMDLAWGKVLLMWAISVSTVLVGALFISAGNANFIIRLAIYGIFILVLYNAPIWSAGEKGLVKAPFKKAVSKLSWLELKK